MTDADTIAAGDRWERRNGDVDVGRALGSDTRRAIYRHLRAQGCPLTARDLAAVFEVHPNVARGHLETLADAGLIAVGRRKNPAGGRPARLYCAVDEDPGRPVVDSRDACSALRLQVRLLAHLADPAAPLPRGSSPEARAREVGVVEGRELLAPFAPPEPLDFLDALEPVIRALRPSAPQVRVVRRDRQRIVLVGVDAACGDLLVHRPALAEALLAGLLEGAFAAVGADVEVATDPASARSEGSLRWTVTQAPPAGSGRVRIRPALRVDARDLPREHGVVRAMREVGRLRDGEVLEVLAEGPGSPAAFAGWCERAGHSLLGVERTTDRQDRPAIRLLIRKGS